MAKTHTITIGDRTFTMQGVTMGTVRRLPDAFRVASTATAARPDELPQPEVLNAMIALVHDGIRAAKVDLITLEQFEAIVDSGDMATSMTQIAEAIALKFAGEQVAGAVAEGNAGSPTSAT